ncbi:neural/ectodermal development factor IMP-L2 isoform X2 [Neocloeon triangulifer]|uniref:neural/ectodermal development factor IMP-L2 isoform X2 n=1 Tax=Neocloeon triangulifer TaxID=2078957 RepID=UPI00286EC97E|nr:neural/ectodermal development factor IMP-L2 isoform X2 [Neocloeon triangulifer]
MAGHVPRIVSVVLLLVVISHASCSPTRSASSTTAANASRFKKQNSPSHDSISNDVSDSVSEDWVKVSIKQGRLAATAGGSMEYTCEAVGSPSPSIVWLKDGLPIQQESPEDMSDNYIVVDSNSNNLRINSEGALGKVVTRLHIPCITMKDSGAVYSCLATSGVRSAVDYAQLRVTASLDNFYGCLEQQAEPPQITTHTPTILQSMGKDVELLCKARGSPEPEVYWVGPNGKTIMDGPRFRVLENGSLVITRLTWDDMGEYKCKADNLLGEDTASTFLYPMLNEEK